ncbi:FAD-binding oxidoreductase [bacterium]|nr:FAD-binding oxidoreductase [bacterium]
MFGLRFPQLSREHTESYYAATATAGEALPQLDQHIEVDIVVLGGGFSGVNTALELAERGYQVALLEANRISWGASGRNGGQIIGGLGHNAQQFSKVIGEAGVRSIYDMGVECVEIIRERVAKYQIDCDMQWGYCDVALKPRHMKWFEQAQTEQQGMGYPHSLTLLDAAQLSQFVASDAYIGGLYNANGGGHLHSLNLCLGEARAALGLGAKIYEQSRVREITRGEKVTLHTDTGSVRANKAVLCGNAYMQDLVPELATRVLPASSCMIATEALSQEQANAVLPQNVAVCDPRTALDYFRLSADKRLLFGGLSNYTGLVPKNYAQVMRRKMLQIFPQLQGIEIEFAWDGQMGIGLNRMPQLGMLGDNIYYVQAYSGHGVAPTHMMARIIAEAIHGDRTRFDIMSKIHHWPFPGGRYLRRPGMALGMLYFKGKDYL